MGLQEGEVMVESMLSDVICCEFEKVAGKNQGLTGKALHIGFGIRPSISSDQYRVVHMYIFGPMNYVYVVIQEERIDEDGNRHVGPMELLSYHDSCWRDAVRSFLSRNRGDLSIFRSFDSVLGWYDVIVLTDEEKEYLRKLESLRRISSREVREPFVEPNPFDNRGSWAGIE